MNRQETIYHITNVITIILKYSYNWQLLSVILHAMTFDSAVESSGQNPSAHQGGLVPFFTFVGFYNIEHISQNRC